MGLDIITLAAAKSYTDEKVGMSEGGAGLPPVTAENNGNFLQVVDGKWVAAAIPFAEDPNNEF